MLLLDFMTCLQIHTVMTIERSIADVSIKTPKATNPRISSIRGRLSPISLMVGRMDCLGSICDAEWVKRDGCLVVVGDNNICNEEITACLLNDVLLGTTS